MSLSLSLSLRPSLSLSSSFFSFHPCSSLFILVLSFHSCFFRSELEAQKALNIKSADHLHVAKDRLTEATAEIEEKGEQLRVLKAHNLKLNVTLEQLERGSEVDRGDRLTLEKRVVDTDSMNSIINSLKCQLVDVEASNRAGKEQLRIISENKVRKLYDHIILYLLIILDLFFFCDYHSRLLRFFLSFILSSFLSFFLSISLSIFLFYVNLTLFIHQFFQFLSSFLPFPHLYLCFSYISIFVFPYLRSTVLLFSNLLPPPFFFLLSFPLILFPSRS